MRQAPRPSDSAANRINIDTQDIESQHSLEIIAKNYQFSLLIFILLVLLAGAFFIVRYLTGILTSAAADMVLKFI